MDNRVPVVKVPADSFAFTTSGIVIPKTETIIAALSVNPDVTHLSRSQPGTEGTETVKLCAIVPIPHEFSTIFLAAKDGITWQEYFANIYPEIEGRDDPDKFAPLTRLVLT